MISAKDKVVYQHAVKLRRTRSRPTIFLGGARSTGIDGPILTIGKDGLGTVSCVDFVMANAEAIRRWFEHQAKAVNSAAPFSTITLAVEDASPDTCLSVILIAELVKGRSVPPEWISAARDWELGRMPANPMRSWGANHNALVHALMDIKDPSSGIPSALRKGVDYTAALIRANADPNALAPSYAFAEADALHVEASAYLDQELLSYRNLSENALRVQLAIPFAGSNRKRMVDAIFFAEHELKGSIKAFAQADHASWSGAGFLFAGVYRPDAPGGNDMTFSVAPGSGLSLLPLWAGLETLEDQAWEGTRPRNKPRPGVLGFERAGTALSPSNDPWWDGSPTHEIVAAPGMFGSPTRLDWQKALDEVWRQFAPGADLMVRMRGDAHAAAFAILRAPEETTKIRQELHPGSSRWILDLERVTEMGDPPLLWCPTLEQSLAALIQGKLPELTNLPEQGSYDMMRIGSGAALVAAEGVLLLGSPQDRRFPAATLRSAIDEVARTLDAAIRLETDLAVAREAVRKAIPSGRGSHKREALTRLYAIQLRARVAWPKPLPVGGDKINSVVEACERRWRARERFDQVLLEAKELEAMISSSTENRAGSLLSGLAIYGFPAALFGNVLGAAFGPMTAANESPWHVAMNAVYWFAGLTILASLVLFLVSEFNRSRWNAAMAKEGSGTTG